MSDKQVMDMPIGMFWLVYRSIGRLLAEDEMRLVRASATPNLKKEDSREYISSLKQAIGGSPIVAFDEEPDESGVNRLKQLSGLKGL